MEHDMTLSEITKARIATHVWYGCASKTIARNTGLPVEVIEHYRQSKACAARLARIKAYFNAKT